MRQKTIYSKRETKQHFNLPSAFCRSKIFIANDKLQQATLLTNLLQLDEIDKFVAT